jgi:4a-hydroxytetrahydrobiopterin dehydratase
MSSAIETADVPEGWELSGGEGGCLRRRFELADFAEAWRFMTGVAAEAERLEHHPDWSNSWNVVTVELRSHDAGAVTERDLALARAIDAVLEDVLAARG